MKIFFIGTVDFSFQTFRTLINQGANIVGVATKSKSSVNSDHADLSSLAQQNNIPVKYIKDINSDQTLQWINSLKPDIIFCFGWSYLLKKELLELAPMGVLGFHPSELPKNRGRHPIIWALALGLPSTASSFFFMREGADDGPILSQKKITINYEDDAQSLYDKITYTATNQIISFLPLLQNNSYTPIEQNHSDANIWRKRGMADGLIDFRMSANAIYNLVRALTHPYVGAHIEYKGEAIKIWKVESIEDDSKNNIEPGKIIDVEEYKILVKCYDGLIRIMSHEFKQQPKVGEYL